MQMFTTQGGLAGLRAEGRWGGGRPGHRRRPSLWLPCPHGRDRGPPRTRSVAHPPCQLSQGQRHQARLADVPVCCVCGPAGREGRGWEGGQDGCRQHLQHLICITADTLLDQENGARNNKGGGDSLRGPLRFSFLASKLPVLRARGQPHSRPLVREMHLLLLQTPHPSLPLPLAPDPPALPLSFLGAYSTHPSFLWEPSP